MKFALTATFALVMILCSPLLLWLILTAVTEGAYQIYSRTTALRTKLQSATMLGITMSICFAALGLIMGVVHFAAH